MTTWSKHEEPGLGLDMVYDNEGAPWLRSARPEGGWLRAEVVEPTDRKIPWGLLVEQHGPISTTREMPEDEHTIIVANVLTSGKNGSIHYELLLTRCDGAWCTYALDERVVQDEDILSYKVVTRQSEMPSW